MRLLHFFWWLANPRDLNCLLHPSQKNGGRDTPSGNIIQRCMGATRLEKDGKQGAMRLECVNPQLIRVIHGTGLPGPRGPGCFGVMGGAVPIPI